MEENVAACYENLANAIVAQAARDYIKARTSELSHPDNGKAQEELREIRLFFFSGWYRALTSVEASYLIRRMERTLIPDRKNAEVERPRRH